MTKAKVVFASITGNNEDIADIVTEKLEEKGVTVDIEEISQCDPSDFEDVDLCIVVPYTYDEGALPDEGIDFFEDLNDLDLTGKVYGVAGSGDTFYGEYYCVAVDKFEEAFENTGATKGTNSVKINLAPDTDEALQQLDVFVNELVAKISK
ncbi:flavodoxin [Liquorilactobacillus mali]|uniref:Flavodoxin n=2 Tax=Liquorilactobacillus mali TaxID=1618 RepID=J0UPE8_9LACO|nr:flavodoxin [Liquorilactobacillus mali]EJE97423.1 Flavodoxin [Liquorilactobacillus mali KCTC 3596 = DSM 20444]KRN11407.1 Flavodoxin [Liquorilactobacillus mali KCTC 3596 = DSM 20444]KRN27105.1 Flavodoxin [Liquorilactobacillus mali]MDC7953087.1 flavodoxin [Liquorilactobacillus mali]MDN7145491.1 flavodoxin [Liquorilactobacillus mali]